MKKQELKELLKFDGVADDLAKWMLEYADMKLNKIELKLNSVLSNNKDIVRFSTWWCNKKRKKELDIKHLRRIKSSDVRLYIDYLIKQYSNNSVSKYVTNLKNFIVFLKSRDILDVNNFDIPMELPKEAEKMHFYDPIDAKKLVEASKHIGSSRPNEVYAIMMMFSEGALRKFEVLNMKYKDYIDFRDHGVFKLIGKGDKPAFVPLKLELREAIDAYLESGERKKVDSEYLFPTNYFGKEHYSASYIDNMIKKCKEVSNVEKFSCHKFRHVMTTRIGRDNGSLEDMQAFLRHSSKQTTESCYKQQNQLLEIQKLGDKFKNMK